MWCCRCGLSPHLPCSESADPCYWGWQTDRLYLRKRVLEVWERHLLSSLWTWNMLLCWRDDHSSSASPLPGMLTFIASIRCNSSVNQPMFRETERAAKSPAAPIYSPVNFPPLSRSLMSSTSVSTSHPQHPSLSFIPPHLFLFLSFLRAAAREDAWFMKLYFYQLLRRKRGEKQRQREGEGREKEREEWRGECEERAQGEGGQESVEETSITPRPLGWKWRREVGWGRNMMDLTKIRGDTLQSTWVVCCYTLDIVGWLVISLISHISLCACNIFCQ